MYSLRPACRGGGFPCLRGVDHLGVLLRRLRFLFFCAVFLLFLTECPSLEECCSLLRLETSRWLILQSQTLVSKR